MRKTKGFNTSSSKRKKRLKFQENPNLIKIIASISHQIWSKLFRDWKTGNCRNFFKLHNDRLFLLLRASLFDLWLSAVCYILRYFKDAKTWTDWNVCGKMIKSGTRKCCLIMCDLRQKNWFKTVNCWKLFDRQKNMFDISFTFIWRF